MKILVSFLIMTGSLNLFASATTINCKAENVLDPINKNGNVTFTFNPLTAIWTNENGQPKILFNQDIICGKNISNIQIKPTCTFQDNSDNFLKFDLSCDTKYGNGNVQWFAVGSVTINSNTGNGKFECRTKYGTNQSIILNLNTCH